MNCKSIWPWGGEYPAVFQRPGLLLSCDSTLLQVFEVTSGQLEAGEEGEDGGRDNPRSKAWMVCTPLCSSSIDQNSEAASNYRGRAKVSVWARKKR